MSVIIRLQNLPWSANALDIRNYFRGLSIPEGGVHIVGGELGDAFIAFSTDEDARQAMMLDGGKIKEIQVKLLLSSRSEMHKVIETARQSVPILTLTAPAPAPLQPVMPPVTTAVPAIKPPQTAPAPVTPAITPFSAALGNSTVSSFGIPGIGNPQEIPQPAVIEPPLPALSPPIITTEDTERDDDKFERKRSKEKDRRRSRSRSRSRDRKDRKRDRRDRSRSRERRRRDRSRSRDRRDRKRDRKERSRSRDRSPSRRSRDRRERKSPNRDRSVESQSIDDIPAPPPPAFTNINQNMPPMQVIQTPVAQNMPLGQMNAQNRFNDPSIAETFNKLQELGKKRNPNAFQGEQQQNGGRFQTARGGGSMNRGNFRRDGRPSRFEETPRDCCVAVRNAPTHTSYGDVRRFFPFMIDKHGIKMINDNMGRRTGTIYVRFCDARSKQIALQRKINELKGAEVTVESLDDEAYEAAVDSFLPFRDDNDEEDTSLVIADQQQDEIKAKFTVLKLTELPNFVKEHDIIKTFSEFSLLSITLIHSRITRSKSALVQFVKAEDARLALERKDRIVFGRRHATVTALSDEEFEKAKMLNEKSPEPLLKNPEPRLEELPPPQLMEPVGPRDPRQRRQFDNGAPAQVGVPAPAPAQQSPFFGAPFVQGLPAAFPAPQFGGFPAMDPRTAAANWANRPGFPNPAQLQMQPLVVNQNPIDIDDEPLDCVLMKGLPQDATDRTIVNFLSDTSAVPARIHLMLDPNGLPSGDCFCEFRSTQEARMAATKHGHNLDGCRITVDLVSRVVVEEALEGPKQNEMREPLLNPAPQPFFESPRGGFAPRGSFRGRGGFDRGFERGGFGRGGFDGGRGGFESRGGFRGRGGFDRGRGFERGRGRGFVRGRGGFENGRMERDAVPEEPDQSALEDFGAPGCVVSMENVPFRASVDDIMTFFSEFELTQDDVIRRYNERGQPTGDARVAFRTPFDAQRAVKTRHMDTIHDRRINLNIL